MNRNYFTLEGAELDRLARLSGPTGRRAREELARRERVARNTTAKPQVEERVRAAKARFAEAVEVFKAKAPPIPRGQLSLKARGGGFYNIMRGEDLIEEVPGQGKAAAEARLRELEAQSGASTPA